MAAPTTDEDRERFLEALEETANVTKAAERAQVSRRTAYYWRDDPDFAARWDAAVERGTDALEDEAVRRAHEGYEKPVYQGGKQVGTVREYSDTLLIFMLKGRRPEKFKDRNETALTGAGGGPVKIEETRANLADRIARLASLAGRGGRSGGGDTG